MARAFRSCHVAALQPEGRLVVVFANKQPDAWETLVSAIIRAGFVVSASWPIATERCAVACGTMGERHSRRPFGLSVASEETCGTAGTEASWTR